MSKGTSIYHFSSTVLYNEVFDPRDDLVVSLVRTNEDQEDLGSLTLEGGSFAGSLLGLEPTKRNPAGVLSYNMSNEFENLCLYIFDASVDTLDFSSVEGPSRSTAISAFDVASLPGNIFLSGGNRYYRQPNNANPTASSATVWVDAASASEFRYTYDDANYGNPRNGWEFRYTSAAAGSSTNCFSTTVSSASGLFPWEIPTWYVTNNSSNTYSLSTASTVNLTLSGFTTKYGVQSNNGYDLDGPGASVLTDLTKSIQPDPAAFGSFLSGALVLACVDNNGAFSLSGSQEGFYNSGTETLSSKVFSVRALSALQTTRSAELCTFDFKGAIVPEDGYSTIDDKWKLLRVGFKRNLQDVVLYIRENGIYESQHVFSTDFNLEHLPAGIKVGISYSGHMPMEIQNLTINGVLIGGSAEPPLIV